MCKCTHFAVRLIEQGFFPTAPSQPNLAVSILFLEFYRALFERTGDAVSAVTAALSNFYNRRGYPVVDKKVSSNNSRYFVYLHCSGGAHCGPLSQIVWRSSTVVRMSARGNPPMCRGRYRMCIYKCSPRSTSPTCLSTYHCRRALNNKFSTDLGKAIRHSCCSTTPKEVPCMLWGSNDWPVVQGVSSLAKITDLLILTYTVKRRRCTCRDRLQFSSEASKKSRRWDVLLQTRILPVKGRGRCGGEKDREGLQTSSPALQIKSPRCRTRPMR